ncbi:serine protease Do [Lachnospiraceae bacterium]|nr:serine protease Do [Lachnospiraceae bacterium]
MDEQNPSEFQFIKEKIKDKPIDRKKLLERVAIGCIAAAFFGAVAALSFALVLNALTPTLRTTAVSIPPDEEKTGEAEKPTESGEAAISEDSISANEDETKVVVKRITERVSLTTDDYQDLYRSMFAKAQVIDQSIVTVTGVKSDQDWFDNTFEDTNQASGLIVANNGRELLILAVNVEAKNADKLSVTFHDGSTAEATVKETDSNTGLEIIGVNMGQISKDTMERIREADLGNSASSAIAGKPVIAVGTPYGTSGSVAYGLVTTNEKNVALSDRNVHLLCTDIYGSTLATGVIADYDGEVLGIINQKMAADDMENLLTAYSISDLKELIEKLSNSKQPARLGVKGTDVTEEINEENGIPIGAYVKSIDMDSPAMNAGIQSGDVIIKIGTQGIETFNDLTNTLMKLQPEDETVVTVQRYSHGGYAEMTFEVTLDQVD